MRFLCCLVAAMLACSPSHAGELRDSVLYVDGRPFYPLGSWNSAFTTPEDIASLGMNTAFHIPSGTEEGVAEYRAFMRDAANIGVQVVPYLSYGGDGTTPWSKERLQMVSSLSSEPNLLAWYVGDDLGPQHLDGIEHTVGILREETPGIATVADYIAHFTPEITERFARSVDIGCHYGYPIPRDSIDQYMSYIDGLVRSVPGPMWTWVQNFAWSRTANDYHLGVNEDPGNPVPDPEQVRLVAHSAVNRNVRGLLFFPHRHLHFQPELAAEVALFCHELRLFNDELAAGEIEMKLDTPESAIDASSFTYDGSVVVSLFLDRDHYHRWVDEAVIENASVVVPWTGDELPKVVLTQTPDVVECPVAEGPAPGYVTVMIPRLELAGFMLLTTDDARIQQVRDGIAAANVAIAQVAQRGLVAQNRKMTGELFRAGMGEIARDRTFRLDAIRAEEEATRALVAGRDYDVVERWRYAMRTNRMAVDSLMRWVEARRAAVPNEFERYLDIPYSIGNIRNLSLAIPPDSPWQFVREYLITGPWPLDRASETAYNPPGGFNAVYPPEERPFRYDDTFDTIDGAAGWTRVGVDISGQLDFLDRFATSSDVVSYARVVVVAPEETETTMGLGSNDGCKVWINGEEVYAEWEGRRAFQNRFQIPVTLREGENEVLVKIGNLGASWGLYLSFMDPDRKLEYRVK